MIQRILAAIGEYTLVQENLATYESLGYRTASGDVPAWKLQEALLLNSLIRQAERDKPR